MDRDDLQDLLTAVRDGDRTPDEAAAALSRLPYADLGFARVDHHRALRQGLPEAIFAPGKTAAQCAAIVTELLDGDSGPVLLTRANASQVATTLAACPGGEVTATSAVENERALVAWRPAPARPGRVLLLAAGTADLPVATECHATLRAYGYAGRLVADCGVAGLHRLLDSLTELDLADAVVVFAGMEGALASVVGGLCAAPVVAVPTSVGYGAGLEGVTALLAMHASCASGITVVGIDNGFGAACAVARVLGGRSDLQGWPT